MQHCFIASFGLMFHIFHLRDILVTQQIFLLQVEESCCEKQSLRLLCATHFGFVACFSSNLQLVLDPHQAISALHFSNLQQNVFVAWQVDHARWKTRNINPKLATKQCCTTSWELFYLVFHCLNIQDITKNKSRLNFSRCSNCEVDPLNTFIQIQTRN